MSTILTDDELMAASIHPVDAALLNGGACATALDMMRAIEQAVLQSEQVQAWKRDAERLESGREL